MSFGVGVERKRGVVELLQLQVNRSVQASTFMPSVPPLPSLFMTNSPANGSLELSSLSLLIPEGLIHSFAHFSAWETYDHEPRVLGKVVGIEA